MSKIKNYVNFITGEVDFKVSKDLKEDFKIWESEILESKYISKKGLYNNLMNIVLSNIDTEDNFSYKTKIKDIDGEKYLMSSIKADYSIIKNVLDDAFLEIKEFLEDEKIKRIN